MGTFIALCVLMASSTYLDEFNAAQTAYESKQYDEAVRRYENIVATGAADPALFYNLGNAYFRLEQVPAAIANYERALALDPRMELAEANLRYALAATQRNLARPLRPGWQESLLPWDDNLRLGEVRLAALLCWTAFWGVLLWRVLRRHRAQVPLAILLLLAAAAFMTSMYSKSYPVALAVANAAEVEVRTGANPADTVRFTLMPGDRVRVETESNGWLRVATVDGERGWAQASDFVLVGPPFTAAANTPVPSP